MQFLREDPSLPILWKLKLLHLYLTRSAFIHFVPLLIKVVFHPALQYIRSLLNDYLFRYCLKLWQYWISGIYVCSSKVLAVATSLQLLGSDLYWFPTKSIVKLAGNCKWWLCDILAKRHHGIRLKRYTFKINPFNKQIKFIITIYFSFYS